MKTDYERKNGTGAAFPNAKTTDLQPDYKGNLLSPQGEEMDIAIWKKISKGGKEYFSIQAQVPFVPENKKSKDDLPSYN